MANCHPSASSQGWNHEPHDRCLEHLQQEVAFQNGPDSSPPRQQLCGQVVSDSTCFTHWALHLNMQSIHQQYLFYRTQDLVWHLFYCELHRTLLGCDRRHITPASSVQTKGVCLSSLLFQVRRPSEHTFHIKHMNCSTHNDKELTVPLTEVLHILKVHLRRLFKIRTWRSQKNKSIWTEICVHRLVDEDPNLNPLEIHCESIWFCLDQKLSNLELCRTWIEDCLEISGNAASSHGIVSDHQIMEIKWAERVHRPLLHC